MSSPPDTGDWDHKRKQVELDKKIGLIKVSDWAMSPCKNMGMSMHFTRTKSSDFLLTNFSRWLDSTFISALPSQLRLHSLYTMWGQWPPPFPNPHAGDLNFLVSAQSSKVLLAWFNIITRIPLPKQKTKRMGEKGGCWKWGGDKELMYPTNLINNLVMTGAAPAWLFYKNKNHWTNPNDWSGTAFVYSVHHSQFPAKSCYLC